MKKFFVVFTFFVFMFSLILNGFSVAQTKDTGFTNQATYIQTTKNQHDCISLQNTKECPNPCHSNDCGCVNHSCTGTISLFNLVENYQIVPLSPDNAFPSDMAQKSHDIDYHIIHPPQA